MSDIFSELIFFESKLTISQFDVLRFSNDESQASTNQGLEYLTGGDVNGNGYGKTGIALAKLENFS